MTTAELARWFAATRPISQLEAIRRADSVVIRRALKTTPSDTIFEKRLTPA